MAKRYIEFKNFRNLGLEENHSRLMLNNTLEEGKMGTLIEVIGANNSGKSNVLDGIFELCKKRLVDNDVTTLGFGEEIKHPEIKMFISDGNDYVCAKLTDTKYDEFTNIKYEEEKVEYDRNHIKSSLQQLLNLSNSYGYPNRNLINNLINIVSNTENDIENYIPDFLRLKSEIEDNSARYGNRQNNFLSLDNFITNLKVENKSDFVNKISLKHFGIRVTPRVIKYTENILGKESLKVIPGNLNNSQFFKSLFKAVGIDIQNILELFKEYEKYTNPTTLKKIRKIINNKMETVNNRFNKLYFASNDEYKFVVDAESNLISFGMSRGKDEEPIMLEMQSTGFKWFFNFYFNFICSNSLERGDIIIMDEPATNLHPQGQVELRKFIKEFAQKNDLTFIIATHSPFLIDPDNFDELRIVTMSNNRSSIDNLFSAVNVDDPDSILPIKESLTIKQNVLYDMDTVVVWVEGITDYNYLTMFKNLLNIKNVSFIPFKGVGKTKEEQEEILKRILKIKFYKKSIFLDADKAGKSMAKLCEETDFKDRCHLVSEVKDGAKEIEDLFSLEEIKKYESINKDSDLYKKAYYSSLMKNFSKIDDFSEETINNFKKLFDIIID
ncbi:MAG: AAA family ATPase [Clostridia bacterium]|nr:AAA family ATPase [Clostridia bacterium]